MHDGVAALRAAHPRTRFARPSARHAQPHLGLLSRARPGLVPARRRVGRPLPAFDARTAPDEVLPRLPGPRSRLQRGPRMTWTRPGRAIERRSATRRGASWPG